MKHALAAIALATLCSCTTFGRLSEPGPVTDGDRVAFRAMVEEGLALVAGSRVDEAAEVEWVRGVAKAYAVMRFGAGAPVIPLPGETPIAAAIREGVAELAAGGEQLLESEAWVVSAVRLYAGWRFLEDEPLALPPAP